MLEVFKNLYYVKHLFELDFRWFGLSDTSGIFYFATDNNKFTV